MRSSVFLRRIILLLLFAVLLSGILSSCIYIFVTQRMYVRMKAEELTPIARTVAEMMASAQTGEVAARGMMPLLDRENRNFLGASLYIYNAQGQPIMNQADMEPGKRKPPPEEVRFPEDVWLPDESRFPEESQINQMLQADLNDALSGKEVSVERKDTDSVSFLVVGVPIKNDGEVIGAVIFTKPMSEMSDTQRILNYTLLISTLVAFLVMLIPAYFAARQLVVPIRQMGEVARAMAKGDFSKRADDRQSGEIGELGRAMNRFAEGSERLEQTRQDYVANVSHELRTPVAALRAMGETLRDGMAKTPEKQHLFYNNIVRESLRLSRLIDDLLELSRLQSGAEAMQKNSFDLGDVLCNTADMYSHMAAETGLHFTQRGDIEMAVPVYGNPDRIEQVLVILLDNAIKHTPEGGDIVLSTEDKDSYMEVCISNTGDGISAEDLPYIFDRFYKADKSHSGGGSGLGLSIAKEIMNRLKENIWAESGRNGTRFVFTVSKRKVE